MPKARVTKKWLRYMWRGDKVLSVGYCDLQHLLSGHSPDYYTCGVYGWNFDAYYVHGVLITTGYRGTFGKSVSYELTSEYDKKAEELMKSDLSVKSPEKYRDQLEGLLQEYLKKAVEE